MVIVTERGNEVFSSNSRWLSWKDILVKSTTHKEWLYFEKNAKAWGEQFYAVIPFILHKAHGGVWKWSYSAQNRHPIQYG